MMKIACLGAASITPRALIFPAKVRGDVTLQAVAARNKTRARAYADKYDFNEALTGYVSAVTADNIDIIYNALPNHLHATWSVKALEAGKHVICEKPMAMNTQQARHVVDAARASGRRVIEAIHSRYHPAYAQMLTWLEDGKIGRTREIYTHFNVAISERNGKEIRHLPETGGGAMMDLGCYPLHWVLSVAGEAAQEVQAKAELNRFGVDERLTATLTFSNDLVAHISTSMAQDEPFSSHLSICGEDGKIEFFNPVAPHQDGELRLVNKHGNLSAEVSRISTYCYQLNAIIEAIKHDCPLPTENGAILLQQQMLDRVYRAAGLGALRDMSEN